MPASHTLGGEAWIQLIGSPGNMQVSGSKGREQLAVEVADGITSGLLLRLPSDEFWPGVHLAPYAFADFGGILLGSPGNGNTVRDAFYPWPSWIRRCQWASSNFLELNFGRSSL
jgi:hypothetical protein